MMMLIRLNSWEKEDNFSLVDHVKSLSFSYDVFFNEMVRSQSFAYLTKA